MPLVMLLAAVAATALAVAGETPAAIEPEARVFAGDGGELHYRIVVPRVAAGTRVPLVLCMHGSGERGAGNGKQVGHFRPLLASAAAAQTPAVWVLPQVPSGQLWATYGWGTRTDAMQPDPNPVMRLARALVVALLAELPIDPDRVYVVGLSMGGYGTWEFAQRWPELPAAIVPVCGGGDPAVAERLKQLPIWTFHGTKDSVIAYEKSKRTVDALQAIGAQPKFTTYEGVGHDSWSKAFREPELLPWLFAQRRGAKPAP